MARKSSNNNDPFGFGSFDFGVTSFSKRTTLASNRFNGRLAEDSFELEHRIQGHDVQKIHKGGDFIVQKRDIFGNKVGKPKTCEIKTGNAKLSKAQQNKKRRSPKGSYKVVRY